MNGVLIIIRLKLNIFLKKLFEQTIANIIQYEFILKL